MPLQADWRHAPGDPRSLALWTVRAVFETAPSVPWNTLLVVLVVAVVVVFCALGAWIGSFEGGFWNPPKRLRRAPVLLASLAATPGTAPAFPVSCRIYHREVRTGQDEGMATFIDGWLVFEGRRTSFALPSGHAWGCAGDIARGW